MTSYHERLDKLFAAYAPERRSLVPKLLEKYRGKEDALLCRLVKEFGPEPGMSTKGSLPINNNYQKRLVRFYEKYAPNELSNVDETLRRFAGREEELFGTLMNKYGPEPTPSCSMESIRGLEARSDRQSTLSAGSGSNVSRPYNVHDARWRLARMLMVYDLEKLTFLDQVMGQCVGNEEETLTNYVERYGPEPPSPDTQTPRIRLKRFVDHYVPHKATSVDVLLKRYDGQIDVLFSNLVRKFGPEPPAPFSCDNPPKLTSRQRLLRFYKIYARDKVDDVDFMLQRHKGDEETMFRTLVEKYGPEPPFDTHNYQTGAIDAVMPAAVTSDLTAATPDVYNACVGENDENQRTKKATEWLQQLSLPSSTYRRYVVDRLGEDRVSAVEDHFGIPRLLDSGDGRTRWVIVHNSMTRETNSSDIPVAEHIQDPTTAENISANFACLLLILETVSFPLPEDYVEGDVFSRYPLCTLIRERDRFSLRTSATLVDLLKTFEDITHRMLLEEETERQHIKHEVTKWEEEHSSKTEYRDPYVGCVLQKALQLLPELEEKERKEIETLEGIVVKGKSTWFHAILQDMRESRGELWNRNNNNNSNKPVKKKNTFCSTSSSSFASRRDFCRLLSPDSTQGRNRVKQAMTYLFSPTGFPGKEGHALLYDGVSKNGMKEALAANTTVNTVDICIPRDSKGTPLRCVESRDFTSPVEVSPVPRNPHATTAFAQRVLRFSEPLKKKKKSQYLGKKVDTTGRDKWGPTREGRLSEVAPLPCANAYEAVLLDENCLPPVNLEASFESSYLFSSPPAYVPFFFEKEKTFSSTFRSRN